MNFKLVTITAMSRILMTQIVGAQQTATRVQKGVGFWHTSDNLDCH